MFHVPVSSFVRDASKVAIVSLLASLAALPALAIPEFAQRHDLQCGACHSVVPALNAEGLEFRANGYRLPASADRPYTGRLDTIPFATWLTARHESRAGGPEDSFLPKVELVSGGPIGERVAYFVEWRIVSDSLRSDGTLGDRGGRFEDLWVSWDIGERHALQFGQYRSLNQVDVSLRLSPQEPGAFRNGIPTGRSPNPRLQSLKSFSPSSRSPGIGWAFRSIEGDRASDGLFHHVTVPFAGELSIPLGSDAASAASFELAGPKGVYAETFWRAGVRTLGGHVFVEDDNWLATGVATWDLADAVHLLGAVGVEDHDGLPDRRTRATVQAEYLWTGSDAVRGGIGIRADEVEDDGQRHVLVPYAVATLPNRRYTILAQAQYRDQEGNEQFVFDLSIIF